MNQSISTDVSACIGCKTCEIACVLAHGEDLTTLESAHFNARLKLEISGDRTEPIMCHQCEDAPCITACPNGALIEQDHHVKVIQHKCIGCKTCVLACPYGAIEVKMRKVPIIINGYSFGEKEKAEVIKCDLCSGKGGEPACIQSCPTKALTLLSTIG